ncbi:MAG TPA: glycosyltransferase [Pseudonocardiaceae bacterium]|jgi:glycosyltransferase involved in cell wall biosynthesis|nr:glycosyltransferase [Pseudonocardiaceae bacterium]
MIALGIGLSCLAACCYGTAASLQNGAIHAVAATPSATSVAGRLNWRQLRRLVIDRTWLLGLVATAGGALFHVLALSLAPLVVVQPIGVLAIGITVLIAVAGGREQLTRPTVLAVLASTVGVGLFVLLAAGGAAQGSQQAGVELRIAGVTAGIVLLLGWVGARSRGWLRTPAFSSAAGVCFGLVSVLTRVVSEHLRSGVGGIGLGWVVGIPIAVALGAWFVQQAHASGRPDTVVACQSVIDPLVGVLVGACCFGEAGQVGAATLVGELACATLAVVGIVTLALRRPTASSVTSSPAASSQTAAPRTAASPTASNDLSSAINRNSSAMREYQVDRTRTSGYRTQLKLVIGADTFPPDVNGAARFAQQLAGGLAGLGHEVHVICPSDRGPASTEVVGGVTVHRVRSYRTPCHPTFRVSLPWQAKSAAADLLEEIAPDLVHVQAHFVVGRGLVRAAAKRRIPIVATNHFMPENLFPYLKVPRWLRTMAARLAWRDLAKVLRSARVVTAPTPTAADMLRTRAGLTKALARSCGVDLDHFQPATSRPGSADHPPAVLFVGRLDAEKHVDELLRAIALLPEAVNAEIVGDGACRADLTALADSLGIAERVHFHGFVSDEQLRAAYARCSVFCMPGVAELQSLATMEAMAAGKPVVAANAVALPHLVRPGDNGWLFEPGDVAGLAKALGAVLDTPETLARMGAASRRMIAKHDLGASLDAFDTLYREALGWPAADLSQAPERKLTAVA